MSSKCTAAKGDWICSEDDCGNRNFSKRDKCNKCGKKRRIGSKTGVEIGKSVAEKSKGLFSADDWMCKSCGNINWSRRNICNICNTNKINTQGQRTGFGGGFNEREEVVEYIHRDEDEEEFDEFGMRKKRNKTVPREERKVEEDGDEGEEEEGDDSDSDEEGDLSKYDLLGDGGDTDKKVLSSSSDSSSSSSGSGSSSGSDDSGDSSDDAERAKRVDGGSSRHRSRSPVSRGQR